MRLDSGTYPFRDNNGTVWLGFSDWGTPKSENVMLCVHGDTRQSRDFGRLAETLAKNYHVIGFDLAGHGKSGWLADKKDYSFETSTRHINGLLDYRNVSQLDWIGTFTGGILGMMFAARDVTPVRRLILNDTGAFVSSESIKRFIDNIENTVSFKNLNEASIYFRTVYSGFGALDDADWSDFIIRSVNREANGSYSLHYDPEVIESLKNIPGDIDLWDIYNKIQCPVLLLRGENSDVLSKSTAERMTQTGPKAQLIEFKNCGHAPSLMNSEHIIAISNWLRETQQEERIDDFPEMNEAARDENASAIKSTDE